jgi:hypothetical protein
VIYLIIFIFSYLFYSYFICYYLYILILFYSYLFYFIRIYSQLRLELYEEAKRLKKEQPDYKTHNLVPSFMDLHFCKLYLYFASGAMWRRLTHEERRAYIEEAARLRAGM